MRNCRTACFAIRRNVECAILAGVFLVSFSLLTMAADGDPDPTFGGGVVSLALTAEHDVWQAVAVQADGKSVVAGYIYNGSDYDFAVARYNSDGSLDTGFGSGGVITNDFGSGNDVILAVTVQSDGKIVAAGHSYNGADIDFAVARYNADGSPDTTFSADGWLRTDFGSGADVGGSVLLQSDGKIVVGGYSHNGADYDFAVARYNSNGSLDTTFSADGKVTTDFGSGADQGGSVLLQTDGKIVLAGYAFDGSYYDFAVVRYNTDGSLDTSFDSDGKVTTPVGSYSDKAFTAAIQTDGKILLGGYRALNSGASVYDLALARYDTDGSLDTTFSADGKVTTAASTKYTACYGLAVQSDGKIVAAGRNYTYAGVCGLVTGWDIFVARYNTGGSLDADYGSGGVVLRDVRGDDDFISGVALTADEKAVMVGFLNDGSDKYDTLLARFDTDGSPDGTLHPGRVATTINTGVDNGASGAIQSDGKIVVAGPTHSGTSYDFALARYTTNGTLDATFDTDGRVTSDFVSHHDILLDVAVQTDGKIIAVGYAYHVPYHYDIVVARYNTDGSLDTSFSGDGSVLTYLVDASEPDYGYSVAIQSDGKIVVAGRTEVGTDCDFAVVRYNTDGSLDSTFDSDGKVMTAVVSANDWAQAVAVQSDGKILAAGFADNSTDYDFAVLRYNTDGSLDSTFDSDGKVITAVGDGDDQASAVAVQSDGKILVAGYSYNGADNDFAVVRYNTDGSLDTGFGSGGMVTTDLVPGNNDSATGIAIDADGRIFVGGTGNNNDFAVVRYKSNGSLDAGFGVNGVMTAGIGSGNDYGRALALDSDGRPVLFGNTANGSNTDFGVMRFESTPVPAAPSGTLIFIR